MKFMKKLLSYILLVVVAFSFIISDRDVVQADSWVEVKSSSPFIFFKKAKATYVNKVTNGTVEIEYTNLRYVYNNHSTTGVTFFFDILYNGKQVYSEKRNFFGKKTTFYSYQIDLDKVGNSDLWMGFADGGYTITPANFEAFFPPVISVKDEDVYMYENDKKGMSHIELVKAEIIPYSFSNSAFTKLCSYKVDMSNFGAENPSDKVSGYTQSNLNVYVGKNGVISLIIEGKTGTTLSESINLIDENNNIAYISKGDDFPKNLLSLYEGNCPSEIRFNPDKDEVYLFGNGFVGASSGTGKWKAKDYLQYIIYYPEIEQPLQELNRNFGSLLTEITNAKMCESTTTGAVTKYNSFKNRQKNLANELVRIETLIKEKNIIGKFNDVIQEIGEKSIKIFDELNKINDCLKEKNVITEEAHAQNKQEIEEIQETISISVKEINKDFKFDDTPLTCGDLFTPEIINFIKTAFFVIQIGAVILTVILGILDFSKATIASDADAIKKAFNSFIRRLIACGILILLPSLISFLLDFVSIPDIINSDPFCEE